MKKTAAALSITALFMLNACGSPEAEAKAEEQPSSASSDAGFSDMSEAEMEELAADTVFDMQVADLLGVAGEDMRPVADQICSDVSTMTQSDFPLYAMTFIDTAAAKTPGVTEMQLAQFMGVSIGTYCPESAYLIP